MNIFLDLDGTLITTSKKYPFKPLPRPYLYEFLKFCFIYFDHVNIWTAGNKSWLKIVKECILNEYLNQIGNEIGMKIQFTECLCQKNCKRKKSSLDNSTYFVKPLKQLFGQHGFTADNCIILDDSEYTFEENRENAILVPTYTLDALDTDSELLELIDFLSIIVDS